MAYTKRQLVTALSIIFHLALTGVSAYTLHTIRFLNLPIPTALAGLTVGLPAITGLIIESATEFRRRAQPILSLDIPPSSDSPSKRSNSSSNYVPLALNALLVLQTALAALTGTYLTPTAGLACGLERTWGALFAGGRGAAIERVQNRFDCCGLHGVEDKAWPEGMDTCAERFGRSESCFVPWRAEEQRCAGLVMMVVVLLFLWEVLIITDPLDRPTWLHRVLPIAVPGEDSERGGNQDAPVLSDGRAQYTDDADEGVRDLRAAVPRSE